MRPAFESTTLYTSDFQLAEWKVRPALNRLEWGEVVVHIEPKSMAVLVDLAEHAGEVRSKRRLLRVVWGDTSVSDDVLTGAICGLRKALGDDARDPQYIETIPRRGYRLKVEKTALSEETVRYRLLERLGGGGMGVVYKAEDTLLRRTVALKFLPSEVSEDQTAKSRFLLEARAEARLSHPNIGVVHDTGEDPDGRMFIAMDYYDGETIKKKIERGPLPIAQSLQLAEQIARGLAAAHAEGIVHRDIKPANVMVTERGQAKIVDFGVAKLTGSASFTRTGHTPGTIAYMSPEQLQDQDVDHHTDLWSLGVVLYEMISGERPFGGDSRGSAVHAILNEDPEPLLNARTDCPQSISDLATSLLRKEPANRPSSAGEVANRLAATEVSNDPTATSPAGTPRPPVKQPRAKQQAGHSEQPRPIHSPWRRRATIVASILLLSALTALGVWWQSSRVTETVPLERDWLLVGDFSNETNEEVFDQTVREAVTIALEQSHLFNVFPRTRVFKTLRRMEQPELEFIDEATGTEIGLRENLDLLVTGSVQASGGVFRLLVRAVDVGSGALLYAGGEDFSRPEELFGAIDALVSEACSELGESRAHQQRDHRDLRSATTGSLEALQLYSRALDRMAIGDYERAIRLLKGALQLDSNFAMAQLNLGRVFSVQGDPEQMKKHFQIAFDLRHSVTDRERFLIEGLYHGCMQEYEKQVEAFEALAALFPDDLEAHTGLAGAYHALEDLDGAAREYREVVRLAPQDVGARGDLIRLLAVNGAADQALRAYEEATDAGLESPHLLWGLGLARVGRGELDLAESAFKDLHAAGGTFEPKGSVNLARVAMHRGRLEEAERLLKDGVASDERASRIGWETVRRHMLARIYLLRGQDAAAARELETILTSRPELRDRDYREIGALLSELGDVQGARAVLATLNLLTEQRADLFLLHCKTHVEAAIAFSEERFAEALALFQEAYLQYPALVSRIGAARAAYAMGDFRSTLEEVDAILADRVGAFNSLYPASWPLAHVLAARAHIGLAEEYEAQRLCDEFYAVWEGSDLVAEFGQSSCVPTEPRSG